MISVPLWESSSWVYNFPLLDRDWLISQDMDNLPSDSGTFDPNIKLFPTKIDPARTLPDVEIGKLLCSRMGAVDQSLLQLLAENALLPFHNDLHVKPSCVETWPERKSTEAPGPPILRFAFCHGPGKLDQPYGFVQEEAPTAHDWSFFIVDHTHSHWHIPFGYLT